MMGAGVRLAGSWRPLDEAQAAALQGTMGVYELADLDEVVQKIGFAGGRSLFGLRSELQTALAERGAGTTLFRIEENMQYMSRYDELLMVHVADHGHLPNDNTDERRIGRLSPG
jgi:hypothetical protein